MRKNIFRILLSGALAICSLGTTAQTADFNIVPRPQTVKANPGAQPFVVNAQTVIVAGKGKGLQRNARFLQQYIEERTGMRLNVVRKAPAANFIALSNGAADNAEGYSLRVDASGISICGGSDAGTFYGVQTLRKALPHKVRVRGAEKPNAMKEVTVPAVSITDAPRFSYRGTHLDVSRHYVAPDSIRRFIDMLALHNINRFHWHLTDDQGWRLEIKKYPRLTEVGAKRRETVIGHNSGVYDGVPYGGFYTQQECRDIVKYAAERYITIVPEIDMPGHMLGALAAYPELGCTGGPYEVWRIWGVSDDVLCAGNDKTLRFIDDVLDEVAAIFPSEYIHVGGDECPKTAWKKCPKCQQRIEAEGLQARDGHSAEERLQSYVIRHAEAHLAKLGRKMIGWDETLEGGLADGATVMSWRGEAGGIEAAKQHHDVIMTPNTYLYFDYYQALDTSAEPDAIGGYLPLDRVYSYEPVSDEMLRDNLGKYIVGVQANMWTEYMPTYRQIEYMALPRLSALAEIQWTQRGTKDYADFTQRTLRMMQVYDEMEYNYARHLYDVHADFRTCTDKGCVEARLSTVDDARIYYTLDGSQPSASSLPYEGPIVINADAQLRYAAIRLGDAHAHSVARKMVMSHVGARDFAFCASTARPIRLLQEPHARYTFGGSATLVDGVKGESTNFQSGQWIGFSGTDLDAVIDLGQATTFREVAFNTCVAKGDWIFDARRFEVWASDDGTTFREVAATDFPAMKQGDADGIIPHALQFDATTARYVKVKVLSEHSIPEWHGGKGAPGFLFVDELMVR